MSGSLQRQWLTDILESVPSFAFLALLRSNVDLETAGWIGATLAAAVLIVFRACKVRFNPILLGINIHLLLVTPIIVTVFRLGASETGETLTRYSYQGVLITIFLVGLMLTFVSREGFVGHERLSKSSVRKYSVLLLLATLAAIAWSFIYSNGALLGVALPIIALFALRRLLIARSFDSNNSGVVAVSGGAMLTYGPENDSS
ncbi:hypothetical protein [Stappia sp.]